MWGSYPVRDLDEWHVLYVKPRQEKVLGDDLSAMGIGYFLPLSHQTRFYGNRKCRVDVPLFAGYVFLRGTLDDVYEADRTRRVARIIRVGDQQLLHRQLTSLHIANAHSAELETFPFLTQGTSVEVRSGPFKGMQGVVQERKKMSRLILQVAMLGKATSLEIDGSLLEPLN